MYATPFGNKSTLFFPECSTEQSPESALTDHHFRQLDVAISPIQEGWKVFMFIPVSQLTALGAGWGDHTVWTVLCGRYNYNNDMLMNPELSMTPPLSRTDFHLIDEYAVLAFQHNG